MTVTWTDNSNNETGFRIQYSTSSAFTTPTTATVAANVTTYTATVPSRRTYYVRVQSYNATGPSAWTPTVSVVAP